MKIKGIGDLGTTPNNVAHPGCDFQVMWYGFDEGPDAVSTVSFTMQAPTADAGLTVDGPTSVFVGGDPATGAGTATGLDGSATYHLTFDGTPQAQQGYHVRLTVSTPYSHGNDTKTKVFWVAPCTTDTSPGTSTTGEDTSGEDTSTSSTGVTTSAPTAGTPPVSIATPVSGADTLPPTVLTPGAGMTSSSVVASTPATAPVTAAVASSAVTAASPRVVPTAVDAGEAGALRQVLHAWHGTALPLLLLGLGLGVGTTGLVLRRRAHAVRA